MAYSQSINGISRIHMSIDEGKIQKKKIGTAIETYLSKGKEDILLS